MEVRYLKLENTEHLKNYCGYGVDTEGNVWSFKQKRPKILSPGWKKKNYGYKTVFLTDKYGNKKTFLIHRLIALAFIPTEDITLKVIHRNGDLTDNRLENLEWENKKENNEIVSGFNLDQHTITKIKEVHSASIRKGLKVPSSYEFMNNIIDNALNQYIMQYGLRKVMNNGN